MSTAVAPPPTNNPSFQAVMGAGENAPVTQPNPQSTEAHQDAPATQTHQDPVKPVTTQQKPQEGKTRAIDRVGAVKAPDAGKKEDAKTDATGEVKEGASAESDPDAGKPLSKDERRRFGELRKIEDQWKAYNEKEKPEIEKLRTEYEQLKARQLKDDERAKLEHYSTLYAEEERRSSKDFNEKFTQPITSHLQKIQKAGKHAGLSEADQGKLLDASDIPDDFERNKAIRNILAQSTVEESDLNALLASATSAAQKLHDELYPAERKDLLDARNASMAERHKTVETAKQREMQERQQSQTAREEVYKILSENNFKPLLEDKELVIDGVHLSDALKNAEPATEPNDKAFEVMMGHAAPYLVEKLNRALSEIAELKKGHTAANGSKPKMGDALTAPAKTDGGGLKFEEVFSTRR